MASGLLPRPVAVGDDGAVNNLVPVGHPRHADIAAWLRAHGFAEKADGEFRKRVGPR